MNEYIINGHNKEHIMGLFENPIHQIHKCCQSISQSKQNKQKNHTDHTWL